MTEPRRGGQHGFGVSGMVFVVLGAAITAGAILCGAVIWGGLDEATTGDSAALTLQTLLVVTLGLLLWAAGEALNRWDDRERQRR